MKDFLTVVILAGIGFYVYKKMNAGKAERAVPDMSSTGWLERSASADFSAMAKSAAQTAGSSPTGVRYLN